MNKNTALMTAALAAGAMALTTAGLAAPAFAGTEQPDPTPAPTTAAQYELPSPPTAEELAAAGLTVEGLTITPGADSYTVSADSISLANGAENAVFSIGDNRSHNGGVNYVDWVDVSAANNGAGYSVTIPIGDGDYTITVSAGYTGPDSNPLLGNLAEEGVTVPAE